MSGGSHNYLCQEEFNDAGIEYKAARLEEMGMNEAARDTRKIISQPTHKLRDLWRHVEWYDSFDYGLDQVQESSDKYMQPAHITPTVVDPTRKPETVSE